MPKEMGRSGQQENEALLGVMQEAENHDLLQPLVHVTGGNGEDVNCVGIVFRAELLVVLVQW